MNPVLSMNQQVIANKLAARLQQDSTISDLRAKIFSTAAMNGYQNQLFQYLLQKANEVANVNLNAGMPPDAAINDAAALVGISSIALYLDIFPNEQYGYTPVQINDVQTCRQTLAIKLGQAVQQPQMPAYGTQMAYQQPVYQQQAPVYQQPAYQQPVQQYGYPQQQQQIPQAPTVFTQNPPVMGQSAYQENRVHYSRGAYRGSAAAQAMEEQMAREQANQYQPTEPAYVQPAQPVYDVDNMPKQSSFVKNHGVVDMLENVRPEPEVKAEPTYVPAEELGVEVDVTKAVFATAPIAENCFRRRRSIKIDPVTGRIKKEIEDIVNYADHKFGSYTLERRLTENREKGSPQTDFEVVVAYDQSDKAELRVEGTDTVGVASSLADAVSSVIEEEELVLEDSKRRTNDCAIYRKKNYVVEAVRRLHGNDALEGVVKRIVENQTDFDTIHTNLFMLNQLESRGARQLIAFFDKHYTRVFNDRIKLSYSNSAVSIDSLLNDFIEARDYLTGEYGATLFKTMVTYIPQHEKLKLANEEQKSSMLSIEVEEESLEDTIVLYTEHELGVMINVTKENFELGNMVVGEFGMLRRESGLRLNALSDYIARKIDCESLCLILETGETYYITVNDGVNGGAAYIHRIQP